MGRRLIHRFLLRPIMRLLTGLRVEGAPLPTAGPAIVVANHNSHVDTALLLAVFPNSAIPQVRPVAARQYFCRTRLLSWFSRRVIGIVPIERGAGCDVALAPLVAAMQEGRILIVFPEGTRGEPGHLAPFKMGVAVLAGRFPTAPVVPVWLEGTDRVLPKGKRVPVRRRCRVVVGERFDEWGDGPGDGADRLRAAVSILGGRPA